VHRRLELAEDRRGANEQGDEADDGRPGPIGARAGKHTGGEFPAARAHEALERGGELRVMLWGRQWSPANLVTPLAAGLYHLPFGPAPPRSGDETAPCSRTSACLSVNHGRGPFGLPVRLGVSWEMTLLTIRAAG
jgi:hypothetical protein